MPAFWGLLFMSQIIKVMVVDDSLMSRRVLSNIINSQPDMKIVATAPDPIAAEALIKKEQPDVITLDVEMPKMDGLSFLRQLMRTSPVPVIMVSSYTEKGAEITLKALEYGAIDFLAKPKAEQNSNAHFEQDLIAKVHIACRAKFQPRPVIHDLSVSQESNFTTETPNQSNAVFSKPRDLILIGSSTGGTEALRYIFDQLPEQTPAILVTQHMPQGFTKKFAERLNVSSKMTVIEAKDGDVIKRGCVYIAPGGRHLGLAKHTSGFACKVVESEPINRHCPSVEYLFESALKFDTGSMMAIMLTGMGKDGASAMAKLHSAGTFTICQDEKTSVVFGMPGAAIALGAADKVLPLQEIPHVLKAHSSFSNQVSGRALSS